MNDLHPPPIPSSPRRGLPAWAITLIIFVAVLFAALVVGGVVAVKKITQRAEQNRKNNAETARAVREVQSDMRSEFEKEGSVSVESGLKAVDKMRAQIEKGASAGGDQAKISKVFSDLLGGFGQQMKAYGTIAQRMEKDPPLDITTIRTREDIARRRALGKEMLEGNRQLLAFCNGAEDRLRANLQRASVAKPQIESAVKGFMNGYGRSLPLQRRIRQSDEVIGIGIGDLCDLLDAEWGKWRIKDQTAVFDSAVALGKYNSIMERVQKAADSQVKAQAELLKAQGMTQ